MQLRVEGLPEGWQGSVVNVPYSFYGAYNGNGAIKFIVALTAPANATIGATAPFRLIGRFEQEGRVVEHEARYMTLYGNSHNDRMHVRYAPTATAIVADFLDTTVESTVKELTIAVGQTIQIPVTIKRRPGVTQPVGLVVNGPTPSAGNGFGPPVTLTGGEEQFNMPLTINPGYPAPGVYHIVVARSWSSDLRVGRPGPCTQMIKLTIKEK
jgi:hypothetical protein